MSEIRSGSVTANGLRFSTLEAGEGPLVLLLHGFPDTPHAYAPALPRIAAAGFRAVAPFMRGYAPTEVPRDGRYDVEALGRDALALTAALRRDDEKVVLVGHDWGAAASYAAVGIDPSPFALLVTIAIPHPAAVLPTPRTLWAVRHFASLRMPFAARMARANGFAYIDALLRRWSPAWNVPPGEADAVKRVFSDPASLDAALGYYRAITLPLPPFYKRKVDVPVVVFVGDTDIVAPAVFARARRHFTSTYDEVRMAGGHFMHREDPERFARELVTRLEAVRPSIVRD